MVLKDIQCQDCGRVREMMLNGDETTVVAVCGHCGEETEHVSLCIGGCGSRFRFNDWSGVDFDGQVSVSPPTAHAKHPDGSEEVVCRYGTNEPMHDDPRFHGDRRLERRDQIRQKYRRRDGKVPLVFDGGSKCRNG